VQKKTSILSQNQEARTHKQRLHWMLGISSIPLFGIVAAFGIAPQTLPLSVPAAEVTEEIALPAADESIAKTSENNPPLWQIDQIRRDDTLSTLLERINIRNPEAITFLRQAPEARALATQLRPGRTILSKTTPTGELLELQFQIDINRALVVKQSGDGYEAHEIPLALENRVEVKGAEISSSLFAATDAANIPDQVAIQLANIFSSEIDFNQDLRTGDHFSVIYEASFSDGELIKTGRVLSAEFVNQGKTYRAVLYRAPDGHENYYAPDGKSMQKTFLRSPLEFSRISSVFSLARFHPVLKTWRAHKGVDYAAPIGTLVKAVADATVAFVGNQGGYGNVVMLQHTGGISTVYGHLSRFASGLHKGQKITQGEAIGFVGMTGLATGPHLHYEFRVNGEHRNPLTVALPTPVPLPADRLAEFSRQAEPMLAQLDLVRGSKLASLD
jgi:murein DD-endopeptidase MepM/ murein hydrolase activator NlpD